MLQDSALLVSLAEPLVTAAEANNQVQVERMLGLCQQEAQMQQQAEETATKLKDMYYELTAQLRETNTQEVGRAATTAACWWRHSLHSQQPTVLDTAMVCSLMCRHHG
jgi:hypothetical protein